jgi:hypothetical protein
MRKNISVKLGSQHLIIIDESGDSNVDIYIPNLFPLMQIDSRDSGVNYIDGIINDINQKRLKVFAYKLVGKVVYDFKVSEGSEWNDYPRPQTLLKSIVKLLGRAKMIGYLEIDKL